MFLTGHIRPILGEYYGDPGLVATPSRGNLRRVRTSCVAAPPQIQSCYDASCDRVEWCIKLPIRIQGRPQLAREGWLADPLADGSVIHACDLRGCLACIRGLQRSR